MLETLTMIVHAYSKAGKSTLAGTAPPPVLIMDAEGSTKFLPLRMVQWDPHRYAPPENDGTWDAVIVKVRSITDVEAVYSYLTQYPHPFRSVVLDSISEIQRKMKTALTGGTGDMNRDLWGQILMKLDVLVRGFRDLQDHPTCPVQVVVIVSESRPSKTGMLEPYVQGQMATLLPYLFDIVGYLEVLPAVGPDGTPAVDERGMPVLVRRLHVAAGSHQWMAGERVQYRLGAWVDHPNITTMLPIIYPQLGATLAPSATTPTEGPTG